ncbi:GTP binding protein Cdc42 [Mycena sanguinolenta]|uniref:GTP binding protein Cdc42 n=1 Tax=Mycena sanguinolenta TaxID=230812 RepID=A0A8H6YFG2_9AGAR|nr:GTP binding protein Cdc42 [Mycena sanguinolenta]
MTHNYVKCTLIGDDVVGKTCLLTSYSDKKFPTDYVPTLFGGFSVTILFDDVPCTLAVFDTFAEDPDYNRLRPLAYPGTDVFIICFSVGHPASFANVKDKWFPEAEHHSPGVPRVIAATQIDLRTDLSSGSAEKEKIQQHEKMITTAQGEKLARELKAARYVECSAKIHEGVHAAFDAAIHAAIEHQQRPSMAKQKGFNCVVV